MDTTTNAQGFKLRGRPLASRKPNAWPNIGHCCVSHWRKALLLDIFRGYFWSCKQQVSRFSIWPQQNARHPRHVMPNFDFGPPFAGLCKALDKPS